MLRLGVAYSFQLEARNGDDGWSLAQGNSPPGIGLSARGRLNGIPNQAGVFNFTVQVVKFDSSNAPTKAASQGLPLTVK
ncbi:MAG: putative Ig domain-containing protein [Vicinamibacterales bacterium]